MEFRSHFAVVLLAAALASGCSTPPPPPPPPPPPVSMRGNAIEGSLTASAAGTAETETSEALLGPTLAAVREELGRIGYSMETESPDVFVDVRVEDKVLARNEAKREFRGTFSLKASVPVRHGMGLGDGSIAVENENPSSVPSAQADLLRRALPRVRGWVSQNVRPADTGLKVFDVRVSCVTASPDEDARRFGSFEKAVAGTEGVESFRETKRDDAARQRKYRVVIRHALFPPGRFLEAIGAAHPELELGPLPDGP